jgi:hypothetical protein
MLVLRDDIGRGPEIATVAVVETGGNYGVGVHHYFDWGYGPGDALINVWCMGTLEGSFGPVTLDGAGLALDNDFWKVADVSFGATSCTITGLDDGMGGPLIVTAAAADTAR